MRLYFLIICLLGYSIAYSQESEPATVTEAVSFQERQTFALGDGVYFDNQFDGARLNDVEKDSDVYKLTINPENEPVNPSPWYSFKVWSDTPKDIKLQLVYKTGMHRYYPKISANGKDWQPLDSAWFSYHPLEAPFKLRVQTGDTVFLHSTAFIEIPVSRDTTWISAQELITSSINQEWVDELADSKWITAKEIGKSKAGKSITKLEIGKGDKGIIVFSRQHPPEVTGYLAMQSFVNYLSSKNDDAQDFRDEYMVHVYPMINPDGVDEGHWRHNTGGKDLNRDWQIFDQPETSVVSEDVIKINQQILFCIDFHSTWKDIFYTMPEDQESNRPVVQDWLDLVDERLPELSVYRRGSPVEGSNVSFKWVYTEKNADGLTYEVGDDTDRDLLKKKAEIAAQSLIEILMKE